MIPPPPTPICVCGCVSDCVVIGNDPLYHSNISSTCSHAPSCFSQYTVLNCLIWDAKRFCITSLNIHRGCMANECWHAHIPSLFHMLIRYFSSSHSFFIFGWLSFFYCFFFFASFYIAHISLSAGDTVCLSASITSCAECLSRGPQCAWCFKEVGTCRKQYVCV